ncbi:MAG: hypothetical protein P4L96_19635 [Rhodoferax sp.]|nr:hypothetical protein [Rhodoferax sp.]
MNAAATLCHDAFQALAVIRLSHTPLLHTLCAYAARNPGAFTNHQWAGMVYAANRLRLFHPNLVPAPEVAAFQGVAWAVVGREGGQHGVPSHVINAVKLVLTTRGALADGLVPPSVALVLDAAYE